MGEDIRPRSELSPEHRIVFLGKAAIYLPGTTFMSFFARENRELTRGTRLMICKRKVSKTLQIEGPLTTCIASLEATLNEIHASISIPNDGVENLINGSSVTMDEVLKWAPSNWYIEARHRAILDKSFTVMHNEFEIWNIPAVISIGHLLMREPPRFGEWDHPGNFD